MLICLERASRIWRRVSRAERLSEAPLIGPLALLASRREESFFAK